MKEGKLVASLNRGRYAFDGPLEGLDLTSGDVCEVWLYEFEVGYLKF